MKIFFLILITVISSCSVSNRNINANKMEKKNLPVYFIKSPLCASPQIIAMLKDSLRQMKVVMMDSIEYMQLFHEMNKRALSLDYNKVFSGQVTPKALAEEFETKIKNTPGFARKIKVIDSTCLGLNRIHIELNDGPTKLTNQIIVIDGADTISNLNNRLLAIILKK